MFTSFNCFEKQFFIIQKQAFSKHVVFFSGLNEKLACYKESDSFGSQISQGLAINGLCLILAKTLCFNNLNQTF